MQTGHAAPLATSTPIPPTAATFLVLPVAIAGSVSIAAPGGWAGANPWTLPPGSVGVFRAPYGATDGISTARLSNSADAASGAFVVCAGGTPTPPPYPAGVFYADHDVTWPWGFVAGLGRTEAAHLNAKTGSLGVAFASGSIAIRAPLMGTLALTGPGFSQTVAAGVSGVVPLTGPTGLTCTWAFSAEDAGESNNVFVVGTLA